MIVKLYFQAKDTLIQTLVKLCSLGHLIVLDDLYQFFFQSEVLFLI